jgi:phenylacetate-CoA ligase
MGPGVAQEFRDSKDGLTIWEDHFLPEIVDPETGMPAKEGEIGELVFTSLSKEALPVVRYRTRDLTRLLPGSVTSMRRMARITGRSDDMLIVRGVNLFPSQVEEQILREPALSPHYVLELWRDGPLDSLRIVVEAREAVGDDRRTELAASLSSRVKTMCGVTAGVEIAMIGAVERSIGKAKRVIDRRGQ